MKRLDGLWPQVVAFENLWRAWRKARRGKSRTAGAVAFEMELEANLLGLQRELKSGDYRPGVYRLFTIYERKPRLIAAAPFRDRVVHHAVMNVIEPPLDQRFIHDSYACRRGKGVHAAVNRYQVWARRYCYALKLDVQQYFPSIDHVILKTTLRRHLRDERVLALLERIIDNGPDLTPTEPAYFSSDDLLAPLEHRRGIPIGNLTSQFFANLYLNDLDHGIKEVLRAPAYLRYVDDVVLLADDKARLWAWRDWIAERLAEIRLRLHPAKAKVSQVREGLDLLGYCLFPERRRLRNENGLRFRRRLHAFAEGYAEGRLDWADFDPSVQAWIGHARHAETLGLRERIFSEVHFRRERTERRSPGAAGRRVEQRTEEVAVGRSQQEQPAQQEQQRRVPSRQAAHQVPEPLRSRM
ncbi:MAG: reverse transcriptase/maturase family protein [Candidatus Contendobacter sp.]|nr:reverse transcriptase/maturase family protein [Candidatus Contendobacter sp.]MDG4558451.1 reverse transcriptase/maturase family protein [Candidatus Contendobacter sp.]